MGRLWTLHEVGAGSGPARASGLLNNGSGPKKPWYPQCPPFSRLKVGTSSVGKNMVLLNLEWRKLKGLGELMCALNVCLDIKHK